MIPAIPKDYPLKAFFGSSNDQKLPSHLYGRIHAVPPQQGIPGFQRICFLKFCRSEYNEVDLEQIWKYEGCVLPGGRIIIGRWIHVSLHDNVNPSERLSGPFILWNVDSTADNSIELQEAMRFLDHLKEFDIAK